jgi:MoaA/NifB/PqqE/SkfB family radical SAM enzyme
MSLNSNEKIRYTTDGVYYFSRSTGTNILFDELQCRAEKLSKAPRQVSIALTNICDLCCAHCYVPKSADYLNENDLEKWILELDANGCIGISFGGGEPTLYPKLLDLCKFVIQNTTMAVTLTTHGHRLTRRLTQDMLSIVNFVRISMDGVNSTYESIRHKSFSDFLDCLMLLKETLPFGINYLVNSNTIVEIDEAISIAESFNCTEFLLLPEIPVNGVGGIDIFSKHKLIEWVRLYKGSIPLTVSKDSADGLPIANPFTSETGLLSYAHIDARGFLKSSSFLEDGVKITDRGIIHALEILKLHQKEDIRK